MAGWRLERYDTLASTQARLREKLDAGEKIDRLVIRAAKQTEGEGRRTRRWESEVGGSYQSVALQDTDGSLQKPQTTLAVALGIAMGLNAREPVKVKWPNDLFLEERKIGGVLAEYRKGHLLVGVGINVTNTPPPGAHRLSAWSLDEVHEAVLAGIERGLEHLISPSRLRLRYRQYDFLFGRRLELVTGEQAWQGTSLGIDNEACLQLVLSGGERRSFCSGQVVTWEADVI